LIVKEFNVKIYLMKTEQSSTIRNLAQTSELMANLRG